MDERNPATVYDAFSGLLTGQCKRGARASGRPRMRANGRTDKPEGRGSAAPTGRRVLMRRTIGSLLVAVLAAWMWGTLPASQSPSTLRSDSGGGFADPGGDRQDLRALGPARIPRLCGRRRPPRRSGVPARLRDGQSRIRRPHPSRHHLRVRVRGQAVHGGCHRSARARRQAVARRPGAEIRAGAARFRHADPHPPLPESHQRPAQPVADAHAGGPAAHAGRPHGGRDPRTGQRLQGTELQARRRVPIQQHRLHAAQRRGGARVGQEVRRFLPGTPLQAARHDAHPVARRLHRDRREPRHGLPPGSPTASSARTCRSPTSSATAACFPRWAIS